MNADEKGTLTLKAIKTDVNTVGRYLSSFYKNLDYQKLLSHLTKLPIILSDNVPCNIAMKIISDLEKIGATALYTPNTENQKDPKQVKAERRQAILSALKGNISKPIPSLSYKIGLIAVALSMIILVLIYMAMIIGIAYFTYWHTTHNITILQSIFIRRLAIMEYIAPIIIGSLMFLFMIKPFFVRRVREYKSFKIARKDEPVLFAFMDKLAKTIGSPAPVEIHLDMDINASARFRSGFKSLLNNELVLTIGLPLIAGLNLNQMAGVLAHELGHFSQSAGMSLTFIIRSINFWFERLVFEKDEWDERIIEWGKNDKDYGLAFIVLIAQVFISVTRRILWCLMMAGHAVSCFMLRQMEYNADQYEISLVGSKDFESTSYRLNVLSIAHQQAMYNLKHSWDEGRLANNLPAFIIASEKQIPDDIKSKMLKNSLNSDKSSFFDTHPTDQERIAAARLMNYPSVFRVDTKHYAIREYKDTSTGTDRSMYIDSPPATILFSDFDSCSQKITLEFYRDLIGQNIADHELVGVDNLVKKQDTEVEYSKTLDRYFMGQFSYLCYLGLPEKLNHVDNVEVAMENIKASRENMKAATKSYNEIIKRIESYQERTFAVGQARILLEAGFKFDTRQFNLRSCDFEALDQAEQRNEQWKQSLDKELHFFQEHIRKRLCISLSLLMDSSVSSRITDIDHSIKDISLFIKTANVIEKKLTEVEVLKLGYLQLSILASQLDGQEVEFRLQNSLNSKIEDLRALLRDFKDTLNATTYPFDHNIQNIKLGQFVVGEVPLNSDIESFLRITFETIDRIITVYSRLMGRLAFISEKIEVELGITN